MIETHATCGHCQGSGTCKNGAHNNSCASCLDADGWRNPHKSEIHKDQFVKCSICKGIGWVNLKS